jgi:hypothetical protein
MIHAQVTPIEVARLSHAESIGVAGVHKKPVALLSFFLHSFFSLLFDDGGTIGDS